MPEPAHASARISALVRAGSKLSSTVRAAGMSSVTPGRSAASRLWCRAIVAVRSAHSTRRWRLDAVWKVRESASGVEVIGGRCLPVRR